MRLLAVLCMFACMVSVNILVLIFGWGMQAVNWWVIIGGAIVHMMFLVISAAIGKE